jgi:hypothetical protein
MTFSWSVVQAILSVLNFFLCDRPQVTMFKKMLRIKTFMFSLVPRSHVA